MAPPMRVQAKAQSELLIPLKHEVIGSWLVLNGYRDNGLAMDRGVRSYLHAS